MSDINKRVIVDSEVIQKVLFDRNKDRMLKDEILTEYTSAASESKETSKVEEQILYDRGLLLEEDIIKLAKFFRYSGAPEGFIKTPIDLSVFKKLPFSVYEKLCFYPVKMENEVLYIYTPYSRNKRISRAIRDKMAVKEVISYYRNPKTTKSCMTEFFKENSQFLNVRSNIEIGDLGDSPEKIFNNILIKAIELNATDISITTTTSATVVIRFRILGEMLRFAEIPVDLSATFLRYAMTKSEMTADKHTEKQDSAFVYQIVNEGVNYKLNIRASYAPSAALEGVKDTNTTASVIGLRILTDSRSIKPLSDLGYDKRDIKRLIDISRSGRGLVMFVGATGSGKTSSIYSMLSMIDNGRKNIISTENPAEIKVDFISQLKVGTDEDMLGMMTAILRLDPDIIFTGEARSIPSAEVALESANTSHLTFSTMHTEDAKGVFHRFKRFGIDMAELTSVLKIVVYQKLVRRLCPHCKKELKDSDMLSKLNKIYPDSKFYTTGNGCDRKGCFAGYVSRRPMYEIITMNSKVREAVLSGNIHEIDNLLVTKMPDTIRHEIEDIETSDLSFLFEEEEQVIEYNE